MHRQVVTGHDSQGQAIVVRDERLADDSRVRVLWGADAAPVLDPTGAPPPFGGWWPPPGGVRVSLCRLPPGRADRASDAPWPDIHDTGGFHRSDSIDIVVLLSGSVVLELDAGVQVTLEAGDTLVQNGTRHRWRNDTEQPATMAAIVVGASRAGYDVGASRAGYDVGARRG